MSLRTAAGPSPRPLGLLAGLLPLGLLSLLLLGGCGGGGGGGTPSTPQPTTSPVTSPTPAPSPTGVASPLPTPTATPNPPSPTPTPSPTPDPGPTPAPPTPTPSPTPTPTPTPLPVVIVLFPETVTVSPLGIQVFTPSIGNTDDPGITWGIQEGASGGAIAGDGTYTAPLALGTYHLTVTSHADPSKTAVSTITVANQVTIAPDSKTVTLGDTLPFTASVPGATNQVVTWRVLEQGGGTITSAGVYTAPRVKGVFHVFATSVEDPSKSGSVTIAVQAGGASGGIQ